MSALKSEFPLVTWLGFQIGVSQKSCWLPICLPTKLPACLPVITNTRKSTVITHCVSESATTFYNRRGAEISVMTVTDFQLYICYYH